MIVLATSLNDFRIVATTVDRSIGSTIDRVATLLQIKWSDMGPGPGLEQYCAEPVPDEDGAHFDVPLIMPGKLAFSFAGLHSWVERTIHAAGGVEHVKKRALARVFQDTAFAHLETKLLLALKWCANHGHTIHHVVVSGGVASNALLRQRYTPPPRNPLKINIPSRLKNCLSGYDPMHLIFPDPSLCTGEFLPSPFPRFYYTSQTTR